MFDQAFERAASQYEVDPNLDHQKAWMKLQRQMLHVQEKRKRINNIQYVFFIAVSMFIGAYIFSGTMISTAIDPIVVRIIEVPDRFVQIIFDQNDSSLSNTDRAPLYFEPLPSAPATYNTSQVDLATAERMLHLDIPEPAVLPAGYTFDYATMYHEDGFFLKRVTLHYKHEASEGFVIEIHSVDRQYFFDAKEGFDINQLDNGPVLVFNSEEYESKIHIQDSVFKYELRGQIATEDALQLIESMPLYRKSR